MPKNAKDAWPYLDQFTDEEAPIAVFDAVAQRFGNSEMDTIWNETLFKLPLDDRLNDALKARKLSEYEVKLKDRSDGGAVDKRVRLSYNDSGLVIVFDDFLLASSDVSVYLIREWVLDDRWGGLRLVRQKTSPGRGLRVTERYDSNTVLL
uniref:Transposase n=1 Tax=Panagrellus redivivus TaxID=6233 RepID=A0A7E4W603_PANRE